jgi:hypothetical protein
MLNSIQTSIKILTLVLFFIMASNFGISKGENDKDEDKFSLYSLDSEPFNKTYAWWSGFWWKHMLEIPMQLNPIADNTGELCKYGETDEVFMLAGSFGGKVERTCTVPYGKPLLWNVISSECSFAENPGMKSEKELRLCAEGLQNNVRQADVIIDGKKINIISDYRIQSPLFNMSLPKNNVFGLEEQSTQAVSDGAWVFLSNLDPGIHIIRSIGHMIDYSSPAKINFVSDATYKLIVNDTRITN